jgi:hypothetical protein
MRFVPLLLLLLAGFFFTGCESVSEKQARLAKQYCGSCHKFPEPSLLDKKTWKNHVLPQMGFRMGMHMELLSSIPDEELTEVSKTIPDNAMMTPEEWALIQDYFIKNAPDSLTSQSLHDLEEQHQFTVANVRLPALQPFVTMIRFDSVSEKIYIGTRFSWLLALNNNFQPVDSLHLESPPSDMVFAKHRDPLILEMGIMDPNDQAKGKLYSISLSAHIATALLDSLKRPVHLVVADLNNDGEDEFVISAFGNYTGGLSAYEKYGAEFKKHIIHSLPGTRRIIVRDFNHDGLNDILALITQGNEQITLLMNEGDFKFTPRMLLQFPPVYGSSFFDLADMNNDGHDDIVYTNGDNADYSPILKPYHGIRIYLNDGKENFKESWFYPMHGASQAIARDFDHDNDQDMIAISFFPDFTNHAEQSLIYFKNDNGTFIPQVEKMAANGRWLTMITADLDRDNDEDVIVGALNFPGGVPPELTNNWRKNSTPLLILKNNFK